MFSRGSAGDRIKAISVKAGEARATRGRLRPALWLALVLGALAISPAAASAAPTNPWLHPTQFLDMAHQGGELEAPGNTLFAFKTAMYDRGADSLEMDSYVTKDDHLVILHDAVLNTTTNAGTADAPAPFWDPGDPNKKYYVWDYTLAQIKTLDDAYWFAPGSGQYDHGLPASSYVYRGVADGDSPPPPSYPYPHPYTANDFKVPTFDEVIAAFPHTRINIDMKDQAGHVDKGVEAADALARILKRQPGGDNENVLAASFGQPEMEEFHKQMPQHKSLSASLQATSDYALKNPYVPIEPVPAALQPPDVYDVGGTDIKAPEFLKALVDKRGDPYAIHVWAADGTTEDAALYKRLYDAGVQGFFSQEPGKFAAWLCANHIPRIDGSSHCLPDPNLPELGPWQTIAPPPPPPPPPPTCKTDASLCPPPTKPSDPDLRVVKFTPRSKKVRPRRSVKVKLRLRNTGGLSADSVKVCAKFRKRDRRSIKVIPRCQRLFTLDPGVARTARFRLRVKRKARRGKVKVRFRITSTDAAGNRRVLRLRIKPRHHRHKRHHG